MRGLTILVASADRARFHAALAMAAAQAALGGRARLYLHDEAAGLLGQAGSAELKALQEEALALGASLTVCQSGLDRAGLIHAELEPRVEAGGLIGLLSDLGDDRLVVV